MSSNKPHILLIDDEPQIRRFLRATLTGHEYEVSEAANAAEKIVKSAGLTAETAAQIKQQILGIA